MSTQLTNYQCPACTGPLHFVGESGMLECDYCQSRFTVEEIDQAYASKNARAEENFEKAQQEEAEQEEAEQSRWNISATSDQWGADAERMKAYICPSCAAEIICDETTAATSCPYCGNPTVVPGQFGGDLKPDCIIPFRLSHEDAKAALRNYYKGKKLLPKEFTANNKISEIKGVYVPFWLFDCVADADIVFEGTTAATVRQGNYRVTTTSHYDIFRSGRVPFSNIPVDASAKMSDAHMDAIEPFDFSQLKPFTISYLPGYFAERYGESADECIARAETRAEKTTTDILRNDVVGFAGCVVKSKNIRLERGKASYALLPVYMLTTKYNGENYLFAMNGQTGKFVGNLPVSKKKFLSYFLGIAAGITIVAGTALMALL